MHIIHSILYLFLSGLVFGQGQLALCYLFFISAAKKDTLAIKIENDPH